MLIVEINRVDDSSGRVRDHFQIIIHADYVDDIKLETRLRNYLKNSIVYDSDE